MPPSVPATVDSFVDLVEKSQLIEPLRLDEYWAELRRGTFPDRPYRLARRLVEDGLITNFHAEQLLKGRYKGFNLGNYRILERIGRGGMGTVYLAEHKVMRHRVAIKVLPPEQAEKPAARERFYREARAAAMLSHPNLVRAHDIGCANGLHYLVMEYVDGVSLYDLVTRHGPLAIDRAAHYIGQAAIGLQYAHEAAGMVHRDVKPGNLLVDRGGTIKLLDMGLARLGMAAMFESNADSITRNFNDKSILGTADYIAPEQAVNSQAVDIRADIYGLGATFYYLLTGQPPFPTGTVTQKLMWHQLRQPDPVNELRSGVPQEISDLIARMMSKSPELRPQQPVEVVDALLPWVESEVSPPNETEIPRLCLAAQGPASGTGSHSCINLGARTGRSNSLSSISQSSASMASRATTNAKVSAETPVDASAGDLQCALSAVARRPAPQPPKRGKLFRSLALATAALLGAAAGALACWAIFGR